MTGRRWNLLRGTFLVAVLAGAWWSWRDSGEEVARAFNEIDAGRLVAATLLVLFGLIATGWVWLAALEAFGLQTRAVEALPLFFVSQLGKYIPGSVWSFAAQAVLGRRHGLPPRASASASLLFLGVHVTSGLVFAGLIGWGSAIPAWIVLLALLGGLFGLVPAIYRRLGCQLAGQSCDWSPSRSFRGAILMAPTWLCYSLALIVLSPGLDLAGVLTLGSAFALAHAAGVAIPLAPAGLGAREVVLIALIAPVVGTGEGTMVALVARLLHAAADFTVAGFSWAMLKITLNQEYSERPRAEH